MEDGGWETGDRRWKRRVAVAVLDHLPDFRFIACIDLRLMI